MTEIRFHEMADGRRIAHRFTPGQGPTIVFLPGYMSDMAGSKATALFEMAQHAGRACLLIDYSGCGQSDGDFAEGTLSRWRDEVVAVIKAAGLDKVLLIGSSMGGWLMLMVERALPLEQVHSMIGIAAAPDFTDWGVPQMDKGLLADGETIYEDNPYGPEPTPTHPGFWADGQANLMLGGEIPFDGPVRLLHGQRDEDVPFDISMQLSAALRSDDVQVTLIKDGDHRLSRESDIAVLMRTVAELVLARDPAS
ncbi:alpha/beta hydrolase [Novosphingobium sp. YJ-S2-02]|uniref:Palmitoyl-protein thioesterase ABHD10, mitochondrial n=1 Tax=Novosphingobium aureum TaxID=2792964 RepID=A0A931HGV8_9SPHN|nr:alpha/beta hydrolase [Novosphingobium aureum]MBH0115071.1 alpha/beta hydrolase [Novosphingobium aureum]